jgi:hypothetical protein
MNSTYDPIQHNRELAAEASRLSGSPSRQSEITLLLAQLRAEVAGDQTLTLGIARLAAGENLTDALAHIAHAAGMPGAVLAIKRLGDYVGHPFHGNQWAEGEESSGEHKASLRAHNESKIAASTGNKEDHLAAGAAHELASRKQAAAGHANQAMYHSMMSQMHTDAAKGAKFSGKK